MRESMSPKQEPSAEEMARAEERLTPAQRAASERQAALLERKGHIVLEVNDYEPTAEDRARWPEVDKVLRLSIILKDGRRIELSAAATQNNGPGQNGCVVKKD